MSHIPPSMVEPDPAGGGVTLSPQTRIQVGLAITLVVSAVSLFGLVVSMRQDLTEQSTALRADFTVQSAALEQRLTSAMEVLGGKIETRYISKELFSAEFGSLRREQEIFSNAQRQQNSELKAAVAALQAGGGR